MKQILILITFLTLHTTITAQIFFCAKKTDGTFDVYKNNNRIAVVTDTSIANLITKSGASMNPPALLQNNNVFVNGTWIPLPTSTSNIHVITGDTVMCLTADSIWFLTTSGWNYTPGSFGNGFPESFDLVIENDSLYFVNYTNGKITYRSNSPSGTQGSFFTENIIDVHLLKGVSYGVIGSTITLGSLSASITNVTSLTACIPAGSGWCFIATGPDVYKLQTTAYITQPYYLGLDTSEYYTNICQAQAIAMSKVRGTFMTALDVPQSVGLPKTNYVFSLQPQDSAIFLGDFPQRIFMDRIQVSGYGNVGMFQFDLGFMRYKDGYFWVGDARDNGVNRLNQYNSYGEFVHSYKATDMHDAMVLGDYTYAFGYGDSGSYYITPPMAISNSTGIEYTPTWHQLYPLLADSCNLAQATPLFGSGDIDHGNSVQAFFVPANQKHMVLKSARNLAKYPASFPLCAWWFDSNTNNFSLDYQLIDILNSSPFGFDRDGGHDLQVEMELSDSTSNTWLITQFDNRVCDNPATDPSFGHSATIHYDTVNGWSISDFRDFKASPSTAMGSIDCYPAGTDTFLIIATATSFGTGINNTYSTPQAAVIDFTTKNPVAHIDFFSQKKESAIAYQVNATHETIRTPEIQFTWSENQNTVTIVASNVPSTGNWYWWLGNKPINQPLVIQKNHLINGVAIYASGWYSTADTVPLIPANAPRSRWISKPIWIPSQTTGIASQSIEISIFPNPAADFIEVRGVSGNNWYVELVDVGGGIIFSDKMVDNRIDVSSVPSGVYTLQLSNKQYGCSTKTIILH